MKVIRLKGLSYSMKNAMVIIINQHIIIYSVRNNMLHNSKFHAYLVKSSLSHKIFYQYYCLYNNIEMERKTNDKKWQSIAKEIIRSKKLKVFQ